MNHISLQSIAIDPSSHHFYENRLFDAKNTVLNRDGTLLPFCRAKAALEAQGCPVNTADLVLQEEASSQHLQYFSLGILTNIPKLERRQDVTLRGFILMEPPVVVPELYELLPELTDKFDYVYLHNINGDGYSLEGVNVARLRKLYWPLPKKGVIEPYWSMAERQRRVVVINGSHNPKRRAGELYSARIHAMVMLARLGVVDLYGRGWDRWWARTSWWSPYWLNRSVLMSIYRGECDAKHEVLSGYDFCLCFENMQMSGYITEKIFDCFYVGTIPLYWGAPDVEMYIPPDAYIDVRRFSSWDEMWLYLDNMSSVEMTAIKNAGREFLESRAFLEYYESIDRILDENFSSVA